MGDILVYLWRMQTRGEEHETGVANPTVLQGRRDITGIHSCSSFGRSRRTIYIDTFGTPVFGARAGLAFLYDQIGRHFFQGFTKSCAAPAIQVGQGNLRRAEITPPLGKFR